MHWSPMYFTFNRGRYELMVKDLARKVKVTIESIKDVAKGAPLNLNTWRHMKSRLMLGNVSVIYLKT